MHNCRHSEDAGVTCEYLEALYLLQYINYMYMYRTLCVFIHNVAGAVSSFSSGSVRLTNGNTPTEGRVEIWYSNQWYTVCDDSWESSDATVVCRQLGYQGTAFAHQRAHFGRGSGGILLNNLDCDGDEESLFQCSHNGLNVHNCGHSEDAGVTCE